MELSARGHKQQKAAAGVENIGDGSLTLGVIRNPQPVSPHALNKRLAYRTLSRDTAHISCRKAVTKLVEQDTRLVEQADSWYHTYSGTA